MNENAAKSDAGSAEGKLAREALQVCRRLRLPQERRPAGHAHCRVRIARHRATGSANTPYHTESTNPGWRGLSYLDRCFQATRHPLVRATQPS